MRKKIVMFGIALLLASGVIGCSRGAAATTTDIAITTEHFPDEVFREYLYNEFDTNKNHILEESEILAIHEIVLDNVDIESFRGIGLLSNLESLKISYGIAQSLDVSDCKALRIVNLKSLPITELNVNGCEKLEELYCYYGYLSSLDVSECRKLKRLSCEANYLAEL